MRVLRAITLTIGILLGIEIILRISGAALNLRQQDALRRHLSQARANEIRVLCVGDSNTFGSEATSGNSYPEQLERLLNTGARRFRVFNRGVIGQNSASVKMHLIDDIRIYNPDFIIVLTGINNRWNVAGRDCEISDDLRVVRNNYAVELINQCRLVKVARLVVMKIQHAFFSRLGGAGAGVFCASGKTRAGSERIHALHIQAVQCIKEGKTAEAFEAVRELKGRIPAQSDDQALPMDVRYAYLLKQNRIVLSEAEDALFKEWLKRDLTDIAKIAAAYKKKLIMLTYPTVNWHDDVRYDVARKFHIPVIDFYRVFNSLNPLTDYMGKTGGHPNDAGYGIIAGEVHKVIENELFQPSGDCPTCR